MKINRIKTLNSSFFNFCKSWSSPPPTCQPISCGVPPSLPNTESKIIRTIKRSPKAHFTLKQATHVPIESVSEMGDVAKYECTKELVMELNATEGIYKTEYQHRCYMNMSRIYYHMLVFH